MLRQLVISSLVLCCLNAVGGQTSARAAAIGVADDEDNIARSLSEAALEFGRRVAPLDAQVAQTAFQLAEERSAEAFTGLQAQLESISLSDPALATLWRVIQLRYLDLNDMGL